MYLCKFFYDFHHAHHPALKKWRRQIHFPSVGVYILARSPIALLISLVILLNAKAKYTMYNIFFKAEKREWKKKRKYKRKFKKICWESWEIVGSALTTGNSFVLLALICSQPRPPAQDTLRPLSLSLHRRTHARTIFRCWQFWRLLWQHVTCKPSDKSGEMRRETRGKVPRNAKECLLLCRRYSSYFKLVVARCWPTPTIESKSVSK